MAITVTCALPETKSFTATVAEALEVCVGTACVVELNGGPEFCRILAILENTTVPNAKQPPGRVIRLATSEDEKRHQLNQTLAQEALKQFNVEVSDAPQNVYAVMARFNLDRSRLVIVYHADHRFDPQRVTANLYHRYRSHVEARQVGIRDEAGLLGGIGSCGRPLCCATWLHKFQPVNVRMAKSQGLSLNPNAINGLCGRLKCCLRYEIKTPQAKKRVEGKEKT